MSRYPIYQFKDEFRHWYGSLSVEELITNTDVVSSIQKIEALMSELSSIK